VGSYGQAAALADTAYKNALAKIASNRSSLLRSYGYTQGAGGALSVDPNNPYGKFQQMLGSQSTATHHAEDLHRAAGFTSGYGNAAFDQLRQAQGAEAADLGTGLTGALSDLKDQEQQAAFSRDSALYDAEQQAAQQAIQNQEFNPANVSGIDVPYGQDTSLPSPATASASQAQRNALLLKLVGKHLSPANWAKDHPDAAKRYGISPVVHANEKIIRAAIAARKRKGGR
jgi:hypothetical protein